MPGTKPLPSTRDTAEYRYINHGMSMSEFQHIYWWEWGHRFFGRMIGLVAVLGIAVFAVRKWLTRPLLWKLLGLVALGGLQGAIGWWMVSSGIGETTRVDVAPYRLMTHFISGAVDHRHGRLVVAGPRPAGAQPGIPRRAGDGETVPAGGFRANGSRARWSPGLDAGRSYNDWPLMAGELVPSHYLEGDLGIRSLFEGRAATQFNHRIIAYAIWAASLVAAFVLPENRAWAQLYRLRRVWSACRPSGESLTLLHAAPMNLRPAASGDRGCGDAGGRPPCLADGAPGCVGLVQFDPVCFRQGDRARVDEHDLALARLELLRPARSRRPDTRRTSYVPMAAMATGFSGAKTLRPLRMFTSVVVMPRSVDIFRPESGSRDRSAETLPRISGAAAMARGEATSVSAPCRRRTGSGNR
jgi:cytochrome c oxidase assembly protein subunit 15